MNTIAQNEVVVEAPEKSFSVKVVGVGGAGINVMELMLKSAPPGVGFAAVNTDARSLAASSASMKVLLETQLLRGLGTGGDPDQGPGPGEELWPERESAQ